MTAVLLASFAGLCWVAATLRLPILRRDSSSPGHRALSLSLFGLALALTTQVPQVYLWLGAVTRVPNIAIPLGHTAVLLAAWAATVLLLHATNPPAVASAKAFRRLAVLLAGVAAMVGLFVSSRSDVQVLDYVTQYGRRSPVAAYYLIFLAFLAAAAMDIGRLCWRYARAAERDVLRLGLHLIAASGAVALGYITYKAVNVVSYRLALHLSLGYEPSVSRLLISLGTALVLGGTTVSLWGTRLGVHRPYGWFRSYRSRRRLFPLWQAMYGATPEIALYPPTSRLRDMCAARDLDFRLHRRVIEIRDGMLALRPYLDPGVAAAARSAGLDSGLTGDDLDAHAHAAALAAAVVAKESGRSAVPAVSDRLSGGTDPGNEVAWLQRVAAAYCRLPPAAPRAAGSEGRRRVAADGGH